MRVILAGVVLVVSVGVRGDADDRPANPPPVSSTQPSDAPQETAKPAAEEATRWLKLKRGTRVRLMVEDGGPMREVIGRLLESDPTTVTVDTAGGPRRLARDKLFHLEYRTAHRDRGKGAAIGAAITGLAGMAACAVALANDGLLSQETEGCSECILVVPLCGFAAAIPGGAIGFAIGTTGGDWHGVAPDGLTVVGAAAPRRATVALRLRLGHRSDR